MPITSTFFHSTPIMSRNRRFGSEPFTDEAFFCDVNAWLDMQQLAAEVNDLNDCTASANENTWWIVEMGAAPTTVDCDAQQPRSKNGRITAGSRVVMCLTDLVQRMMTGSVVRGQRISSTDPRLTAIPSAKNLQTRKRARTELAKIAVEKTPKTTAPVTVAVRVKDVVAVDDWCDPDDDLCTCRKCRTLTD